MYQSYVDYELLSSAIYTMFVKKYTHYGVVLLSIY